MLGCQVLKHVERTRALLHLLAADIGDGRDPLADFDTINAELRAFDPALAERPQVVAVGKAEGLKKITGSILPENIYMQLICKKMGFAVQYSQDHKNVQAVLNV